MIQIKFKDIDPDTGSISQEKVIATCETNEQAKWIIEALYKHSDEPNRDFFRETVGSTIIATEAKEQKKPAPKKKISDAEALQKAKEIDDEMFKQAVIAESIKETEAQLKAKEIDDEIRRQSVLKYQAEQRARKQTQEEAKKKNTRPPNNGYVPYDQFKF